MSSSISNVLLYETLNNDFVTSTPRMNHVNFWNKENARIRKFC